MLKNDKSKYEERRRKRPGKDQETTRKEQKKMFGQIKYEIGGKIITKFLAVKPFKIRKD